MFTDTTNHKQSHDALSSATAIHSKAYDLNKAISRAQDKLLSRSEWTKRSRFLLQRGFSFDMINALFDHLQIKFL